MPEDKPVLPVADEVLAARLAEAATDREEDASPPPPVSNNFFWRTLDVVGPFLGYAAATLTLTAVLIGWIGGESYSWASYFSIVIVIVLILYIAFLVRRRMQERAVTYLVNHECQEAARLEVARLVLEQSHHQPDADPK